MKFTPRQYQKRAFEFAAKNKACALFLDMGLGKTAVILNLINDLLYNRFEIRRALIVAPKRVATITWPEELSKWDDFRHIRYCVLHGTKKLETLKEQAKTSDVLIINYDGLKWLAQNAEKVPIFDMVVLDESTFVKNPESLRFKIFATFMSKIPRKILLSGKPAPNGLQDLWSQYALIDGGGRLGKRYKQDFIQRWFIPPNEYCRKPKPLRNARKEITEAVRDITLNMRRKDYLDIPDFLVNEIRFDMPRKIQEEYQELKKEFLLTLPSGFDLRVFNEAAMGMKLRQYASGFVYLDEDRNVEHLHDRRLKVLEELVESNPGKPLLVAIQFKEEVRMIRDHFGSNIPAINSDTSDKTGTRYISEWNQKKLPMLIVHPDSVAHGLNMQHGGNLLVIYSQMWDLDKYDQLIKRLDRPGQTERVIVHSLVARGTIDEIIVVALRGKDRLQEAFLNGLK